MLEYLKTRVGIFQGGNFWMGIFRVGVFQGGSLMGENFRGGNFQGGSFPDTVHILRIAD